MKINVVKMLGIMAFSGIVSLAGCEKPEGVGQSTGIAIDKATGKTINAINTATDKTTGAVSTAADKTVEVANKATTATKNAAVNTYNKVGDAAVEKTGNAIQSVDSSAQY